MRITELFDPTVDFVRVRDVKMPSRANANDAGYDWFIPNGLDEFKEDLIKENANRRIMYGPSEDGQFDITIGPHERIKIPSGLRVNIHDKDTYIGIDNKSGIANNKGLLYTSDVIDADYRGECNLCLVNTSDDWVTVRTGQKILQAIQRPKIPTVYNELTLEEFEKLEATDRGTGGFGSSGLTS